MEESGGAMVGAVVLIILVIYWIVPADLIPDGIPVAGYIDDLLATIIGGGGLLKAMDD